MATKNKTIPVIKIITPRYCPPCGGYHKAPLVTIEKIESVVDGWVVNGKGEHEYRLCLLCGDMYAAVVETLPINCSEFPCPQCGEHEHLEYKVKRINAESEPFTFDAKIRCSKCAKKGRILKFLAKFSKVFSIEVGSNGVIIKKA